MHLSLTGKHWILARESFVTSPYGDPVQELIAALCEERNLGPLESAATADTYIPMELLPDLPRAIKRIEHAIETKEPIGIFGDYDCDGVTATALLARFFKRRDVIPIIRLPHRVADGYGLKEGIVRELLERGVKLLVTVDTGIASGKEIEQAQEGGMDVIVLDHHHVPATLPRAFALLHPGLNDAFAKPHPSAAGLAFGLVQALESSCKGTPHMRGALTIEWNDSATDLALATIGTIADLVPLAGINRAIVRKGLQAMEHIRVGPIAELLELAGCTECPSSTDIAFRVAPRINAAGRMDDPQVALRALLGDRDALMSLSQLNSERQAETARLLDDIKELLVDAEKQQSFIALKSPSYHPGIVGLLAGKIVDRTGRPALVATENGDLCTASLRSIPGYSIIEGLERVCRGNACVAPTTGHDLHDNTSSGNLLLSFGGHAQAAGCTFLSSSFEALSQALAEDVIRNVPEEQLVPTLIATCSIDAIDITVELCEALGDLAPFGQGNPEPRFLLRETLFTDARCVGREGKHLRARLGRHKIIGFNLGHLLNELSKPLDFAVRLGFDLWNGQRNIQLFLDDARIPEAQARTVTATLERSPRLYG